jgi:type II secretory pathway component PulF
MRIPFLDGLASSNYYSLNWWQGIHVKLFISQSDRLSLFKKIGKYVEEGIDLQQTIESMSDEYLRNDKNDVKGLLLSEWNGSLTQAGEDFSEAISDWVGPTDAMMIKAGEDGGNLVEALNNVIQANESQAKIISKLKGALGYPVFLLLAAYGMMWMAKLKIIPAFEGMMDPSEWPSSPADFRELTLFITDNTALILLGVATVVFLIKFSMANLVGPIRNVLDRIPPWSAYKKVNSSLFLITLSAMMATGTAAYDAIKTLREYSSPYVQKKLDHILDIMDQGDDLGDALDESFFDNEVMMDIRLYTRGAASTDAMVEIGKASIESTIKSIEALANTVRYIVMGLAGGYMIWMVTGSQAITTTLRASIGV